MHAHSDWRNTGVFAYATGKSYSTIVLIIQENYNILTLLTLCIFINNLEISIHKGASLQKINVTQKQTTCILHKGNVKT